MNYRIWSAGRIAGFTAFAAMTSGCVFVGDTAYGAAVEVVVPAEIARMFAADAPGGVWAEAELADGRYASSERLAILCGADSEARFETELFGGTTCDSSPRRVTAWVAPLDEMYIDEACMAGAEVEDLSPESRTPSSPSATKDLDGCRPLHEVELTVAEP